MKVILHFDNNITTNTFTLGSGVKVSVSRNHEVIDITAEHLNPNDVLVPTNVGIFRDVIGCPITMVTKVDSTVVHDPDHLSLAC